MKEIHCCFENVDFIINTFNNKDYKDQKEHIGKFYIPNNNNIEKEHIVIDYITNKPLFYKFLEKCKNEKGKLLQSFENEYHKEIDFRSGTKIYLIGSEEYLLIKENDKHYRVLTDGNQKGIKWVFRLVREILVRKNEKNLRLFMHGTGIALEGNGLLLLGNSGSGKTTLAVDFLLDHILDKRFVSNDRVFLNQNDMTYFPIPIVFASGTVKNNQYLNKYFRENNIFEKKLGISFNQAGNDLKVPTPLVQIKDIFENTNLTDCNDVDIIVFPKISKQLDKKYNITQLTNRQKFIKLDSTCFTPFDSESLRMEWVTKRNMSMEEISENKFDVFNSLIKNKNIVKLEYGFNSDKKKIIDDLIRR